jgi:nitroreductase
MDYKELLELVKNRRSIRRFKPEPLPEGYVEKIIEVARFAPSGFNMQPWEFVVVQREDLKKRIVEIIDYYWAHSKDMETARESWQGRSWKLTGMAREPGDYSEAPVYILLYGDPRTLPGLPMGVRYDLNRSRLIYTSGLANAFLYMHLAATTLGLASQWISAVQTPYAHCMIKKLLNIPAELEIYDMMALGYPALTPSGKYLRDREEMIHYDDSGSAPFRDETEVREFVKKARNWNIGVHQRKAEEH